MRFRTPSRPTRSTHRHRIVAVLCVVVLVGVVAIWWPREAPNPAPATSYVVRSPVAAPTQEAATTNPPSAAGNPTPISAALAREFMTAPDLYVFAMQARRRPSEGGLFYAQQASEYCRWALQYWDDKFADRKESEIVSTATVTARRLEVTDRYRRRCAGFRGTSGNQFFREIDAEAKDRKDPLLNARAALSGAKTPEARIDAIQSILDARDPLLVSDRWAYLANPDRPRNPQAGDPPPPLWFEAHDFRPDGEATFMAALSLATCRPDSPCRDDDLLVVSCIARGFCAETTDAFKLENPDGSMPADERDRVRALALRMSAAIDRGDLAAFRAPR